MKHGKSQYFCVNSKGFRRPLVKHVLIKKKKIVVFLCEVKLSFIHVDVTGEI